MKKAVASSGEKVVRKKILLKRTSASDPQSQGPVTRSAKKSSTKTVVPKTSVFARLGKLTST